MTNRITPQDANILLSQGDDFLATMPPQVVRKSLSLVSELEDLRLRCLLSLQCGVGAEELVDHMLNEIGYLAGVPSTPSHSIIDHEV